MLDIYYHGTVERISPEAPVPVLRKSAGEKYVPGGACNVAMNVVSAGSKASLFGVTGSDKNGEILEKLLLDAGVDVSPVRKADIETITKVRFLSGSNQQLLRMDIEDAEEIRRKTCCLSLEEDLKSIIPQYDIIVLSDYMKGLLSEELTQAVINEANRHGIRVLVDAKDPNALKYRDAWLLKPNLAELNRLAEAFAVTDEEIIEAGRDLINKCGCEYVLTTCGPRGMILTGKETALCLGTDSRAVYDVTGAGDTVIAYLASCLAQCYNIEDAVKTANCAAGIQVGKVGTASVYMSEVREVMDGAGSSCKTKIMDIQSLDDLVKRSPDKKIVFTNGCFDILHVGHKRYLEKARALGDMLVVGVNSDDSVKRLKGPGRPVNTECDRAEMLAALDCVDHVIVFGEDTPYELIRRVKPKVLVKGGDYKPEEVVGRDIVEENGGEVVIIPLVEGRSTTAVIEKIMEKEEKQNG